GDGDAQHVGVELEIEPVHQPQRAELVLAQRAVQPAPHLIAELLHPRRHQRAVLLVIAVHGGTPYPSWWPRTTRGSHQRHSAPCTVGPPARMRSRWLSGRGPPGPAAAAIA